MKIGDTVWMIEKVRFLMYTGKIVELRKNKDGVFYIILTKHGRHSYEQRYQANEIFASYLAARAECTRRFNASLDALKPKAKIEKTALRKSA